MGNRILERLGLSKPDEKLNESTNASLVGSVFTYLPCNELPRSPKTGVVYVKRNGLKYESYIYANGKFEIIDTFYE